MIPDQFIQELRYQNDLESVMSSYKAQAPGTESGRAVSLPLGKDSLLTVYPENQSFYCFGCGAGGD